MWRGALALGVLLASAASAQDPAPTAQPGGVVTLVIVAGPGPDPVRFHVTPAGGFRLFSAPVGVARGVGVEDLRIGVTLGVPPRAPAGTLTAARLHLEWADGRREARDLRVAVPVQRRAVFWLADAPVIAPAGSVAEVGYGIRNEGNAPDTFAIRLDGPTSWSAEVGPTLVPLDAGAQVTGSIRVRVPASSARGTEHLVRISVAGDGVADTRSAVLMVVGEASRVGNLATVPGSIFVGSSADDDGATSAVALSAAGEIQPGTRLTLDLRHTDGPAAPQAFRRAMGGPRLRLGLEGRSWTARVGDLFTTADLVAGPAAHGRGVQGSSEHGLVKTELTLARPWSFSGLAEGGHVFRAAARYRSAVGDFGVSAASVRRDGGLLGAHEHAGVAVTFARRTAVQHVEAEAGVLHVAEDAGSATGPAAQVRYTMSHDRAAVTGRLRIVPAATGGTAGQGSEAYVAGDVGITRRTGLTGSAHTSGSRRVGGRPYSTADGVSAGVRYRIPGRADFRLLGAHRSNEFVGSGLGATTTRAVTLGAAVPVARVVLDADGQAGRARTGPAERPYHSLRVGGRWGQGGDWARVGLAHQDFGAGLRRTHLDVAGATRVRGAELQAGLSTRVEAIAHLRTASFWTGAHIPVLDDTRLAIGIEHRGYVHGAPWRFSLGATRSFGLPLPVARAPVVSGVIFEDLDGDGVRQPGDPGVAGVPVSLGHLRTTTDGHGRFRFYDSAGGELRVDPAGLPPGSVIGSETFLPSRGHAAIPVVRTASLEVELRLDRNGSDVPGSDPAPATGHLVSLRDATGAWRDAVSDQSGRVGFVGLPPGLYTVVVQRPGQRPGEAPIERTILLGAGSAEEIRIGVPARTREVRWPNGTSIDTSPDGSAQAHRVPLAVRYVWLPGALALLDQSRASASRNVVDGANP